VEHIETVAASDIARFGKQGVIAGMQPLHAYPDVNTTEVWARNIGRERASRAWAWKRIQAGGGRLAFGSDWPVVTLNPWPGVQVGVTRQTEKGVPRGGFVPSERLTVAEMIRGYTLGAAVAGAREAKEGSLEVGKLADLIVLAQDPFTASPAQLASMDVDVTVVGGRVVHERRK
jgi:predicted amidohydrolase YtcJ